jgi:Zn-dependent protease with chaperone function
MARLLVTLLLPAILASYAIYAYFGAGQGAARSSWANAIIVASLLFLVFTTFFLMSLDLAAKLQGVPETEEQRRLRTATLLILVTATAGHGGLQFLRILASFRGFVRRS